MTAELNIVTEIRWKEQAKRDAVTWARATTQDPKRLKDFEAGVGAGWDECISTLKVQGLLKLIG
jgi:hypothetical protein